VPDIEDYRLSPGLNIDVLAEFPDAASSDAERLVREMVLPGLGLDAPTSPSPSVPDAPIASASSLAEVSSVSEPPLPNASNVSESSAVGMPNSFAMFAEGYFQGVGYGACSRVVDVVLESFR